MAIVRQTTLRLPLALGCIIAWSVGPVHADGVSFFPESDIDIRVRIENLGDYPNYDFYLKYGISPGNPYVGLHLTKVEANTLIQLEGKGRRITEVYLLAVPRGQAAVPPQASPNDDKWLRDPQAGALQSESMYGNRSRRIGGDFNGHELDYRVRIEGNRLDVTWVKSKTPWLPQDAEGQMGLLCFGLTLSALLIAVGLFVRRRRKRAVSRAAKTDEPEPS
jgi:hypothetical protein